ncbi:hypothetical protein C1645_813242 [Glomus cerebriforme]|uniref:Uncharacterized protein n=1 Tax=Glomus cerebriforme TaxID=658196 RepID=A0A397TKW7_9GLOM|nr:hypothetical protein C1645_813242 [Glomus cerebriforme]
MAIDKDNNRASYLILKAEILAEIELFYLFPHQRRWETWFPELKQVLTKEFKIQEIDETRIDSNQVLIELEKM